MINFFHADAWGSPMTLIIAIRGTDGLLMAADSRSVSSSGYCKDGVKKIMQVGSNCCVGLADNASVGYPLLVHVAGNGNANIQHPVDALQFAEQIRDHVRQSTKCVNEQEARKIKTAKFIVAGYTQTPEEAYEPVICVLTSSFGDYELLNQPEGYNKVSKAGVDCLATYYERILDKQFSDFALSELDSVAIFLLAETIRIAPTVGAPYVLRHIYRDHVEKIDCNDAIQKAQSIHTKLREVLRKELLVGH